jgi:hypothetical protein
LINREQANAPAPARGGSTQLNSLAEIVNPENPSEAYDTMQKACKNYYSEMNSIVPNTTLPKKEI